MPSTIGYVSVDAGDPERLSRFWAEALGYSVESTWADGDDVGVALADPSGRHPGIAFVKVPEAKTAKNRVHFDLIAPETRDAEVERLRALGAQVVGGWAPEGASWVVMRDPEGNEFCVLPGPRDPQPAPGT